MAEKGNVTQRVIIALSVIAIIIVIYAAGM